MSDHARFFLYTIVELILAKSADLGTVSCFIMVLAQIHVNQ
jgi:hypothetical protein